MARTLEEAIQAFPTLTSKQQSAVEFKMVSSPDLLTLGFKHFIRRGLEQGKYYDENFEWQTADPGAAPRSLDELVQQFKDEVIMKQDRAKAGELKQTFLEFLPSDQEFVPLLEGLYEGGFALDEDGNIVQK